MQESKGAFHFLRQEILQYGYMLVDKINTLVKKNIKYSIEKKLLEHSA